MILNKKILFVDDEPAVLDGYKRIPYKNLQLDTATSGEEAIAAATRNGPYAVVVSDMCMPGTDGEQLLASGW